MAERPPKPPRRHELFRGSAVCQDATCPLHAHGAGKILGGLGPVLYNRGVHGNQNRGRDLPMADEGSVSRWLDQLKDGDQEAAQKLWERYFRRLLGVAREQLRDTPRRAADEEDVALGAFASFCRGVEEGRFPRLDDRDDLWRVLVVLTARKARGLRRYEAQQKRTAAAEAGDWVDLDEIVGREPTPEFAAEVADEYRRLLACLQDAGLEAVARAKLEGYTNEEIAQRLDCSPRTVERKLELIRNAWRAETS
jgi:RNA polymerase sigma factor (sigma-70 family)